MKNTICASTRFVIVAANVVAIVAETAVIVLVAADPAIVELAREAALTAASFLCKSICFFRANIVK